VNPDYIHELTRATIGKVAIVGAIFLIGLGALWMRNIIKIDV
jgi:Flp pilus assembly protein TadB